MGVVYEAIQESLGRHVALKILPLSGRVSFTQVQRFQLEACSAGRLHHGNIVPVYGVGETRECTTMRCSSSMGHGMDAIVDDLRRLAASRTTIERCGSERLTLKARLFPAARWPWPGRLQPGRSRNGSRGGGARASAAGAVESPQDEATVTNAGSPPFEQTGRPSRRLLSR